MKIRIALAALLLVSFAQGKERKPYQTGRLLQMDSVTCGVDEKDGKSFAGQVLGTDAGHKKSRELLCQEYILESERVIYHIRPKDEKHPVLLPVGEQAQFRLEKDKMILRVEDLDNKDRDYIVVSMTPRHDATDDNSRAASRLDHQQ